MDEETKTKPDSNDCESFFPENKIENITEKEISALISECDANKVEVKRTQEYTRKIREDGTCEIPCIEINKKRKKHLFNRNLIPLRLAILFLYGAAPAGAFLSVFLKNRGMSLAEFSSVFSVTFISQLLCASVSGVVADKIGNSKPVLIFHMTATAITIVCLLLTPSIKHDTCKEQTINFSSLEEFESVVLDSDNCSYICFDNNKTSRQDKVFNDNTIDFDNGTHSLPKKFILHYHSLNASLFKNFSQNCSFLCFNSQTNCLRDEQILLMMYVFFTFSFLTFWTTIFRIMDITIMSLANEHGSNFGRERTFGMISETAMAIVVGFCMDLFDSYTISQNKYNIVYWTASIFLALAIIASCNIKSKIDPPGKRLTAKALKVMKNVDVFIFLVVMFIAGSVHCFYWNFNLWLLDDLNAQKILLGLNNACFSLFAIPGLITSKWWLKKLGTSGIFFGSLICYSVNGFGYSFLYNPWLSLILEGTRGFFYNLFRVAAVQHSYDVAPIGLASTVTAVSGAIHFAIGRSAGTFGGGLLMNATGQRTAYRLIAAGCLATAFMYIVFIFIRQKRRNS